MGLAAIAPTTKEPETIAAEESDSPSLLEDDFF
jgi:hypothetical protein